MYASYLSFSRTILPVVSILFRVFFQSFVFSSSLLFLVRPVFSLSVLTLQCPSEKSLRPVYSSLEVLFLFLCSRESFRKKAGDSHRDLLSHP